MAQVPSETSLKKSIEAAAKVAKRFSIRFLSAKELEKLKSETGRTLYLFDVRSPEEFAAGHITGSISAPGGQLVQATDTFAAVHGARIALLDDHGVRAVMTASWLLQMGWPEVFVVEGGLNGSLETESRKTSAPDVPLVSPQKLPEMKDALVLDFATSLQYRAGHVPGAAFAIRSRLENHKEAFKPVTVVCTSPDGLLARYAAADLAALGFDARALEGGTAAWKAAGLAMETGETRLLEPPEDVWYKPYDRKAQVEAAMQDYLQWEVALVEQIRRDPDCRFRDYPSLA
jgi:rhodanese-related sulfurtransferase